MIEMYEITVWPDADARDEGWTETHDPSDFDLETLEDIVEYVENLYSDEVESERGAIEISVINEKGHWVKTLYHISEDTNDEFEKY